MFSTPAREVLPAIKTQLQLQPEWLAAASAPSLGRFASTAAWLE